MSPHLQVVMLAPEHEGVRQEETSAHFTRQSTDEPSSVCAVAVDRLALVTARRDVVESAGELELQWPRHAHRAYQPLTLLVGLDVTTPLTYASSAERAIRARR